MREDLVRAAAEVLKALDPEERREAVERSFTTDELEELSESHFNIDREP